jgi:peroxiredoxin
VEDFKALGYEVAGVTFDDVPALTRFAKRRKIKYTVLADPKSEIIRAFGLVNESFPVGSYGYNIAHPMIVVIGPDGTVARRFSHPDHTNPPTIDAILAELRAN